MIENKTVEGAVDDISHRPGHDQGKADDQPGMRGFFPQAVNIITDDDDGDDPENAQDKLAGSASEGEPESHAFIFRKVQDEPAIEYMYFLAHGQMGFDPDFQRLVSDQDQEDNKGGFFQFLTFWLSLASMLKVA